MLNAAEQRAVDQLQRLANKWPDTLMLFSDNGTLLVVRKDNKQIEGMIVGISNDGGDSGTYFDDDGNELLEQD